MDPLENLLIKHGLKVKALLLLLAQAIPACNASTLHDLINLMRL
ncbi:hypothetical protein [Marinicella meishanensis]|nr:hypothetical protein [Marinicella sp. NBU2979]